MNPFENAEKAITNDVKEVFKEIKQEIHNNYFASGEHELIYIQQAISKYLPTTLTNKNLLLLDTLFNYLTQDARKPLENTESSVVNAFYDWDRQQKEKLKAEFQNKTPAEISLSADPRNKYGAIAGVAGAAGAFFFVERLLSLNTVISALSSAVAGFLAYKLAHKSSTPTALKQVENDINQWLQEEQANTLRNILDVIEKYKQQLDKA